MAPVTICWTQLGSPRCAHPIWITDIVAAPRIVPGTVPRPPARLPPPMMTAAITSSSRPSAAVGSPTDKPRELDAPPRRQAPRRSCRRRLSRARPPRRRASPSARWNQWRRDAGQIAYMTTATASARIATSQMPQMLEPTAGSSVRSKSFSQVAGASRRRSPERPFACRARATSCRA